MANWRFAQAGIPITPTLARHCDDNMVSFYMKYMKSPSDFDVEVGRSGVRFADDWIARQFCEGDARGHRALRVEAIQTAADKTGGEHESG